MTEGRTPTFLIFILAAIVGLIGGGAYAWFVDPVEYSAVGPAELRPDARAVYLQLVGASFAFENDLTRARFRLGALGDPDIAREYADVTERVIAEARPAPILRGMARLSDQLGVRRPVMMVYLATPVPTIAPPPTPTRIVFVPSPTPTPTQPPAFTLPDTPTPLPTLTPTPSALATYLVIGQERVCEPGAAQVRVAVEDDKGQGLPGVEVWLTWDDGADRLVTGLKPESGSGYGDFDIRPGLTYAVAVAESAVPVVTGLKTEQCPSSESGQPIWASWKLTFRPIAPTATPTSTPTSNSTQTKVPSETPTAGPSATPTASTR